MTKYSKGTGPVSASYACGGSTFNSTSKFYKTADQFRTNQEPLDYDKTGKTGKLSKPTGDKSLKVIKPHG